MVNNKKIHIPKDKPKTPTKNIRERLLCWVRLLMASLLTGGKYFNSSFLFDQLSTRPVLAALPVPDGGGPRPQHPQRPLRARAGGVPRVGLPTRYW